MPKTETLNTNDTENGPLFSEIQTANQLIAIPVDVLGIIFEYHSNQRFPLIFFNLFLEELSTKLSSGSSKEGDQKETLHNTSFEFIWYFLSKNFHARDILCSLNKLDEKILNKIANGWKALRKSAKSILRKDKIDLVTLFCMPHKNWDETTKKTLKRYIDPKIYPKISSKKSDEKELLDLNVFLSRSLNLLFCYHSDYAIVRNDYVIETEQNKHHGINLSYTDFGGKKLDRNNFKYSNLCHSIFRLSNLSFFMSDLSYANFTRARLLDGIDFCGATLTKAGFNLAKIDKKTNFLGAWLIGRTTHDEIKIIVKNQVNAFLRPKIDTHPHNHIFVPFKKWIHLVSSNVYKNDTSKIKSTYYYIINAVLIKRDYFKDNRSYYTALQNKIYLVKKETSKTKHFEHLSEAIQEFSNNIEKEIKKLNASQDFKEPTTPSKQTTQEAIPSASPECDTSSQALAQLT